jgi:hypothetical protein
MRVCKCKHPRHVRRCQTRLIARCKCSRLHLSSMLNTTTSTSKRLSCPPRVRNSKHLRGHGRIRLCADAFRACTAASPGNNVPISRSCYNDTCRNACSIRSSSTCKACTVEMAATVVVVTAATGAGIVNVVLVVPITTNCEHELQSKSKLQQRLHLHMFVPTMCSCSNHNRFVGKVVTHKQVARCTRAAFEQAIEHAVKGQGNIWCKCTSTIEMQAPRRCHERSAMWLPIEHKSSTGCGCTQHPGVDVTCAG